MSVAKLDKNACHDDGGKAQLRVHRLYAWSEFALQGHPRSQFMADSESLGFISYHGVMQCINHGNILLHF